ncbi:MAG: hypothetical protein Q7J75_00835 [Rhodoferax sp.]|nr:hypothetical protein [Rhodoferax sp.]
MKRLFEIKSFWVAVLLLHVALSSSALTLGRVRGAVLLGQPLSVSIQVQFEPDEEVTSSCFDADVFYADNRQEAGRVRVTLEATSVPNTANVRVASSTVIDEPVVSVNLRAGCSQKVSRRYVLLADLPSEVARPAAAPLLASALSLHSVTRAVTSPDKVPVKRTAAVPSSARGVAPEQGRGRKVTSKSRLKLDALELLPEGDPVLKSSSELLSVPSEAGGRRAQAAALWKALNMQTQDVLSDARRLQGLQEDLKVLQALGLKNQASLVELSARLQKAQSERFANGLVYGLLVLLLGGIMGLVYLWRRQQRERAAGDNWWQGSHFAAVAEAGAPVPKLDAVDAVPAAPVPELAPASEPVPAPRAVRPELGHLDIDLSSTHLALDSPSKPVDASPPPRWDSAVLGIPVRVSMGRDVSHSVSASLLTLNTQELFDTRQQAEFFIALGQYERAIEVLERCIGIGGEASPLVYLDLLQLFHTLARKADYQKLRERFNALFSGCVPDYATFSNEGNGLETYPEAMSTIVDLWPSRLTLEVIGDFLLRSPHPDVTNSFDLCAFRDLLTLHALVKNVMPEQHDLDWTPGDPSAKPPRPLLDINFPDLTT